MEIVWSVLLRERETTSLEEGEHLCQRFKAWMKNRWVFWSMSLKIWWAIWHLCTNEEASWVEIWAYQYQRRKTWACNKIWWFLQALHQLSIALDEKLKDSWVAKIVKLSYSLQRSRIQAFLGAKGIVTHYCTEMLSDPAFVCNCNLKWRMQTGKKKLECKTMPWHLYDKPLESKIRSMSKMSMLVVMQIHSQAQTVSLVALSSCDSKLITRWDKYTKIRKLLSHWTWNQSVFDSLITHLIQSSF